MRNFNNSVYCKVIPIQDAGIEASACARKLRLRLRLYMPVSVLAVF